MKKAVIPRSLPFRAADLVFPRLGIRSAGLLDHRVGMISSVNGTGSGHLLTFTLVGIPGLEDMYPGILLLFCFVYMLALLGNGLLFFLIQTDASLQTPMYELVSMLSCSDLSLALATLPTVLRVFMFRSVRLPVSLCLAQMFFIHWLSVIESSVLLVMAYDRLVGICNPLRYPSLLTSQLVGRLGLLIVLRGLAVILPIPAMLASSDLCKGRCLSHAFCLHPDLTRLLCSKRTANSAYSMFAVISTMGVDGLLILLSYALILRSVCRLRLAKERWRAFRTCARHVGAVILFYSPMIALSIIHRLEGTTVHRPMAYLHFLLPPALNPVMYGVRFKRIFPHIKQKIK
ncbi:olfactory receptor 51G2-like [Gastrophryne carolinensis]